MKQHSLLSDLLSALALGSGLALFDLLVAASRQGFDIHPAELLFTPIGTTAVALSLIYFLLVRLIHVVGRKYDPTAARVGAAVALAAPFITSVALLQTGTSFDASQRNFLLFSLPLAGYLAGYSSWLGAKSIGAPLDKFERLAWLFWPLLAVAVAIRSGSNLGEGNGTIRSVLALMFAVGCVAAFRAVRRAQSLAPFQSCVGAAAALLIAAALLAPSFTPVGMQSIIATGTDVKPNVLLITIDALRADRLSSYGGPVPTPNIDQLANDGIVFEKATSPASWTKPAILSILSGVSPFVHGAIQTHNPPPPEIRTMPTFLGEAGYATSALGYNWHLAEERIETVARAFDSFRVAPLEVSPHTLSATLYEYFLPEIFHPFETSEDITQATIDRLRLRQRSGGPFAHWTHYFDPHGPYTSGRSLVPEDTPEFPLDILSDIRIGATEASPETVDALRVLYEAEIRVVDENIGQLIAELKSLGLYDDTLIVVTSDHGDEFYEHMWMDHGHSLYEELLEVPLIVKLPAALQGEIARSRISERVSTTSVLPTILDAAGIAFDPAQFSEPPLRSNWISAEPLQARTLFARGTLYFDARDAVIEDERKLIVRTHWDRPELYHLDTDPGEQTNLAAERPGEVARGMALIEEEIARGIQLRQMLGLTVDSSGPDQRQPADPAQDGLLHTLGYL